MDESPALATLFQTLADPTRLRLLRLLDGNELRVQELVEVLGLAQPTVSRHLGVLHRRGLVRRRREGSWTFYSLDRSTPLFAPGSLGGAVQERLRVLTDFANWSEYVADVPPVLLVRVTPKLVEGFWTKVARGAAYTQGMSLPSMKRFKPGFLRMRAFCGT